LSDKVEHTCVKCGSDASDDGIGIYLKTWLMCGECKQEIGGKITERVINDIARQLKNK
jgi:hypothetical protein